MILSFIKNTHGPSDYWVTYFPGILIFGLGMSFTVTPLTTTVMDALPEYYSGIASGVNNAITRISNVLSYAILGALAILVFTGYLNNKISDITIKENVKTEIINEAANLGDAKVPAAVSDEHKKEVAHLYKEGFITAYSWVMRISAALALAGAFMAFLFINDKKIKQHSIPGKT